MVGDMVNKYMVTKYDNSFDFLYELITHSFRPFARLRESQKMPYIRTNVHNNSSYQEYIVEVIRTDVFNFIE